MEDPTTPEVDDVVDPRDYYDTLCDGDECAQGCNDPNAKFVYPDQPHRRPPRFGAPLVTPTRQDFTVTHRYTGDPWERDTRGLASPSAAAKCETQTIYRLNRVPRSNPADPIGRANMDNGTTRHEMDQQAIATHPLLAQRYSFDFEVACEIPLEDLLPFGLPKTYIGDLAERGVTLASRGFLDMIAVDQISGRVTYIEQKNRSEYPWKKATRQVSSYEWEKWGPETYEGPALGEVTQIALGVFAPIRYIDVEPTVTDDGRWYRKFERDPNPATIDEGVLLWRANNPSPPMVRDEKRPLPHVDRMFAEWQWDRETLRPYFEQEMERLVRIAIDYVDGRVPARRVPGSNCLPEPKKGHWLSEINGWNAKGEGQIVEWVQRPNKKTGETEWAKQRKKGTTFACKFCDWRDICKTRPDFGDSPDNKERPADDGLTDQLVLEWLHSPGTSARIGPPRPSTIDTLTVGLTAEQIAESYGISVEQAVSLGLGSDPDPSPLNETNNSQAAIEERV